MELEPISDFSVAALPNAQGELQRICELGKAVIRTEIEGIRTLLQRIDENFVKACQLIHDGVGRIAVSGVGKSGHIGRKLAATLASTGSPAFFVHPSEAKHGDMGMITKDDVVIALSNSGETEEIISILPFLKRLSIPLITLTGRPHSTLAKAATINLDVSIQKEACPLGLAPTTSTTAALVMGDALAMALLTKRGFTEKDFALSHPGGALGRRLLLRVNEIMHFGENIPKINGKASLKEALVLMTQKKFGMTTVINDDGALIGVFTDGDVRRAFDNDADVKNTKISDVMSKNPKTIRKEILAAEALKMMENFKITSLVVTEEHDSSPVGIIHIHDILRAGVM